MAFYLLDLTSNEALLDSNGEKMIYLDGKSASDAASAFSEALSRKFQPRKIIESAGDWRERERQRFASGEYIKPFWIASYDLIEPQNHFLHIAKKDPSRLAYTKDEQNGLQDLQSVLSIETYLERFFPNLKQEFRNNIKTLHLQEYLNFEALEFIKEPEQIAAIYMKCHDESTNGGFRMASCMTYSKNHFGLGYHPCEVYGGESDLSLAIVRDDNQNILARAIVWQERKKYARAYGTPVYDSARFADLLQKIGYSRSDMIGAKINKIYIKDQGDYLLPYLDCCQFVASNGKFFEIVSDVSEAEFIGNMTSGMAGEIEPDDEGFYCDRCEEHCTGEPFTVFIGRNTRRSWCEDCLNYSGFYCDYVGAHISNDCASEVDGKLVAEWYAENEAQYCNYSETYTFRDCVSVYSRNKWSITGFEFNTCIKDDISVHEIQQCRISGEYCEQDLIVFDDWSSAPRAIFVLPNDLPENYSGAYQYKNFSEHKEFTFNVTFAA